MVGSWSRGGRGARWEQIQSPTLEHHGGSGPQEGMGLLIGVGWCRGLGGLPRSTPQVCRFAGLLGLSQHNHFLCLFLALHSCFSSDFPGTLLVLPGPSSQGWCGFHPCKPRNAPLFCQTIMCPFILVDLYFCFFTKLELERKGMPLLTEK